MARNLITLRTAAVAATLVALAGCSFQGSADDPDAGGSTRAGSSSTSSAPGSPTGSPPAASTPASSAPGSAPGSSSSGSAAPATTGAAHSSGGGAAVDRCHTSELTGSLVAGDAAAGNRYATLVLKDTGGQTCTIDGFGGVGLVDAAGHALPTRQVRASSPTPTVVTLRPGATVRAQLHWGAVAGTGDSQTGQCQPTPASLRVIPPDETDPLSVPWQGGPVCEGGTLQQSAYVAG